MISKRRGNSGVDGKDFQLGSVISRENSKIWNEGRQMARDYRYDKILRNRSIGRQGSGVWRNSSIDDSSYRLNFDVGKKNKIHRKSMVKLVKLQSLAVKCCKMRKI
jgi:hypothetical protein